MVNVKTVGWVERSASGAKLIVRRVMRKRWVSRRYALLYPSYNNTVGRVRTAYLTMQTVRNAYYFYFGAGSGG